MRLWQVILNGPNGPYVHAERGEPDEVVLEQPWVLADEEATANYLARNEVVVETSRPLVPKSKLTLFDTLGEEAYALLDGILTGLAESQNPIERRIGKRWLLANEIDPNEPDAAVGIAMLASQNLLPISVADLFAPASG